MLFFTRGGFVGTFNKILLMQNIYYFAGFKGIKISDLEKAVNISPGYISRLNRNDAMPSVDFVASVAEVLGTSVDALLYMDTANGNETEKFIIAFVEKLIKDTAEGNKIWKSESKTQLQDMDPSYADINNITHPLFDVIIRSDNAAETYGFKSARHSPKECSIRDTCYHVGINTTGDCVYLMATNYIDESKTNHNEIEMYLTSRGEYDYTSELLAVIDTSNDNHFTNIITDLYEAAKESSRHIEISYQSKSIMDRFLSEDDNDKLPF